MLRTWARARTLERLASEQSLRKQSHLSMSPVLLFILGVVFVAIGIAVSIALHEVGHLVPAKLFKVRVTKYMIGFGPTLWSKRKGETEYGVKAIPLGGYVSMIGMYPPNKDDGTVRPSSTGMFQTLATEARSMAHEEVGPGDEKRVFYRLPVWKKIIVMLGGPAMNLLIGVALTAVLLMGFGISTAHHHHCGRLQMPGQGRGNRGSGFRRTASSPPRPQPSSSPTTPSRPSTARPSPDWDELTGWIRASAGREVSITVDAERLTRHHHRDSRTLGTSGDRRRRAAGH